MWFITKLLDTNANHNNPSYKAFPRAMWFITKLLDTNANHNKCRYLNLRGRNVIHHEITWYECKSQQPQIWLPICPKCDSSRNYLIRMQITTWQKLGWWVLKMWFITKLLDTNANHNQNSLILTEKFNVIHHEITWYECKSQLLVINLRPVQECDSSRNYLIRMQITTLISGLSLKSSMWFITKLLDTNANHNPPAIRTPPHINVIHHEITWYECKSQPLYPLI